MLPEERRLCDIERNLEPLGGPMVPTLVRRQYLKLKDGRDRINDEEWGMLVELVSIQVEKVWGRRLPSGTRAMLRQTCGLTATGVKS